MGTMNLIFAIEFQMKNMRIKFNMVCNNSWDIFGESFVNHIVMTVTLGKNKVPFSFQDSSSCKNSSLYKV